MNIRTILVNLDVDFFSPTLVHCARDLARRFGAELIGAAAAPVSPSYLGIDSSVAYVEYFERERAEIETRLASLEQQFRLEAGSALKPGWYGFVEPPNQTLVALAHHADLILTGAHPGDGNYPRSVNVGELVLAAGRPVMVAGAGVAEIKAERIVVGWKDSREARRAVVDALPLLMAAEEVIVAAVSEGSLLTEKASLEGALGWMKRHGVKAHGDVYPARGPLGATVAEIGKQSGADLIVAGGYGHTRLREWFLGGMTRDLLADPTLNLLLSN